MQKLLMLIVETNIPFDSNVLQIGNIIITVYSRFPEQVGRIFD